MQPHRAFEERPSFDRLWGLLPQGKKGGAPGADFSFASSEFKTLGAFFCNFVILGSSARSRARSAVRRRTRSSGFEVYEPIPFPGADSIFSSRCGAISGRLRFAVSDETPRFKKIDDRLDDLRRGGDARTNIELRRSFGKKFVERLGSYATFRAAARDSSRTAETSRHQAPTLYRSRGVGRISTAPSFGNCGLNWGNLVQCFPGSTPIGRNLDVLSPQHTLAVCIFRSLQNKSALNPSQAEEKISLSKRKFRLRKGALSDGQSLPAPSKTSPPATSCR